MLDDAGGQPRQADDVDAVGKARDTGNGVVEFDRIALAFAHHNGRDSELALRQHVERGEGVADGAEIAADHQQHRNIERRHPVEHRALGVERHHDATDALDQQDAIGGRDRGAAEGDQFVEGDAAAFARCGEIGREWGAEAPGGDARDLVGRHRPPERGQQNRRVAGLGHRRVVAAHHRLERVDLGARFPQAADQPGGDEGLADIGSGRGDEISGHGAKA